MDPYAPFFTVLHHHQVLLPVFLTLPVLLPF